MERIGLNWTLQDTKIFVKIESNDYAKNKRRRGLNGSRLRVRGKIMLMKLCKCGRRIPQGKICPCQKSRHNLYDKTCRDKEKKKFYGSTTWKKIVELIKTRANGLDEYQLANGVIAIGTTVHHIYTVDERPDLKTSLDNLIFVSSNTHNRIHAEYAKGEEEKKELQRKLLEVVRGGLRLFKSKP